MTDSHYRRYDAEMIALADRLVEDGRTHDAAAAYAGGDILPLVHVLTVMNLLSADTYYPCFN